MVGADKLLAGLAIAPAVLEAADRTAMEQSVLTVEGLAKQKVRRRTGRLFSSIAHEVKGIGPQLIGRVGTTTSYAPFVELGTSPHVIVPRNKRALAWRGGRHPVRKVNHPGTRAYPFMRPALEESVPLIEGFFKLAADAVAQEIAHGHDL